MMKKLLILAAMCLSMSAFAQKYTIYGHVSGDEYKGQNVVMYDVAANKAIDTAKIADGGAFLFNGSVDAPKMVVLVARGENAQSHLNVVLEPNALPQQPCQIIADLTTDKLESMGGLGLNNKFAAYYYALRQEEFGKQLDAYYQQYREAKDAAAKTLAENRYDSVEAEMNKVKMDASQLLYDENRDNILGAYAMTEILGADGMTLPEAKMRMQGASKVVAEYAPLVKIMDRLQRLDATAIGKKYTDFDCLNFQTGKMGRLSDVIDGKWALVDFWASWCSPCKHEIKNNLIRIYETYKDKGLEVVGVDVWDKQPAHKKAVEQMGIKYPQVIDDTKNATDTYGIQGIPHIMLVSPDGTIEARDLRGDDIEKAVKKALGL